MDETPAIRTENVVRTYMKKGSSDEGERSVNALGGVSIEIPKWELFGLLGPNGAGKTTLIKVLGTLLLPTSGRAEVAGFDVVKQARAVRQRISMVSGGETSGYGLLTVREQIWMFGQFYGLPSRQSKKRIDELLSQVGLWEERNTRVSALSTGMRQKMNLARALLPDPEVLFLDEPTVGLDVQAARDVRALIRSWITEKPGRTILLTTHYMQEAEELCDRVAIIHQGSIIACETPAALRRLAAGGVRIAITTELLDGAGWLDGVSGILHTTSSPRDGRTQLEISVTDESVVADVVKSLTDRDLKIFSMQHKEPDLEEAFIQLVGKSLEEADEGAVGGMS